MKAKSNTLAGVMSLLSVAVWTLYAQQPAPQTGGVPQAQREGPRARPEGRRLAFLVGAWEEKVKYPGETPEKNAEEGTGRWFARPVMGRFLQFNYEGTSPQRPYRALGMLAYDGETQNYRLIWFDDTGSIGDYRGNFVDENTLSLEHRGKVEGRNFRERITFMRVSPSEVHTTIEQAWDAGEYRVFLEAQALRTGPPPTGPLRREPSPTKPPDK